MAATAQRLKALLNRLPEGVTLVAVSKFHPLEQVREAYDAGQRVFGESRADELVAKAQAMPEDVEWHFIGHVQTNKLRRIMPHVDVIQSVDSERLLRLISAEAVRLGREVGVLLQVHVAAEETKTGLLPDELPAVAEVGATLPGVRILGVMGMASNVDDEERILADFRAIARCGGQLRAIIPSATVLSMGMSDDWPLAVSAGSNMVRVGTDIFGPR